MSRSLLASIFSLRCPSCREGKLFRNNQPYNPNKLFEMHAKCPHCAQNLQPEPGFYYGSMYVSYGLTVAIFVAVVVIGYTFFNPDMWDIVISLTIVLFLVAPLVFRLSRSIWAHMFIKKKNTTE